MLPGRHPSYSSYGKSKKNDRLTERRNEHVDQEAEHEEAVVDGTGPGDDGRGLGRRHRERPSAAADSDVPYSDGQLPEGRGRRTGDVPYHSNQRVALRYKSHGGRHLA